MWNWYNFFLKCVNPSVPPLLKTSWKFLTTNSISLNKASQVILFLLPRMNLIVLFFVFQGICSFNLSCKN